MAKFLRYFFLIVLGSKADIPYGMQIKSGQIFFMGYVANDINHDFLKIILRATNVYLDIFFEDIDKEINRKKLITNQPNEVIMVQKNESQENGLQENGLQKKAIMQEEATQVNLQSGNELSNTVSPTRELFQERSIPKSTQNINQNNLLNLIQSVQYARINAIFLDWKIKWRCEENINSLKAINEFCKFLGINFTPKLQPRKFSIMINKLLPEIINGFQEPWPDIIKKVMQMAAKTLFDYFNNQQIADQMELYGINNLKTETVIISTSENLRIFIAQTYSELIHGLVDQNLSNQHLLENTILRILENTQYSKMFLIYIYEFFEMQIPNVYYYVKNDEERKKILTRLARMFEPS